MNLTYQQANPSTGGGSYLLRFPDDARKRTPCLLVDSGVGVDLDALLGDDEYLAAILLTHAHLDHYATLSDSLRDGAPVYAAEPTAAVLEDVLTEGEKNYDIGASGSVLDALTPIDGWETVVPDVEVAPVPAGHAPGATGFVVRFHDGSRTNHALFTGDFTNRSAAGYPGLGTDLPVDVDVLFANVSTTEGFEETLSESLFTIVERAQAGSSVLVTASGLTGLHVAYLLGHLGDHLGNPIPVTLAGQAAKLYADMDYDVPNVDPVPVFDSPAELHERGTVTVAGPEVPVEGSARRLFETIEDDSAATLVQLTGGATTPVETAGCTVYDFEVVNHPETGVVDELVAALDPIHVVAGHGGRRTLQSFRGRYDERFVWASDDDREQSLYVDGRWSPPPWLSEPAVQSIRAQDWRSNGIRIGEKAEDDSLPPITRESEVDLEAEGLDVERFEARFGSSGSAETLPVPDESGDADSEAAASGIGESAAGVVESESEVTESESEVVESAAEVSESAARVTEPEGSEASARGAVAPDHPTVTDAEAFRSAVLDRLDSLESTVADDAEQDSYRARVVDGGGDVTLLRILDDSDFDHGEELSVVVSESGEE